MVEYTTDGECKGIVAALRSNQKQKKEINTKALFTVEFTTSQDMSGAVKTAYIAAKDLYTALSAAREIPEVGSVIGIKCSYPEKEVLVVW
ncbi:MAG: hypothetical protein EBR82_07330 [Caulobacteraceae bacterium]|nr:hypothetical protein [Caulobacteraceae bacterium]